MARTPHGAEGQLQSWADSTAPTSGASSVRAARSFPESNNHYEAASATPLIHKPPHSNTHCQAQAQERRHGRGPALAHQRQRDTGNREEADHHPDIHRSLKEQNRCESYDQESPRAVTGRLRPVQKAQQQREVKQKHQQSPDETLFLGKGREDEVGLGNGYESQPALRPVSGAFAPKAARSDGNPGLRTLVSGTLRVLRRMNEGGHPLALVGLQGSPPKRNSQSRQQQQSDYVTYPDSAQKKRRRDNREKRQRCSQVGLNQHKCSRSARECPKFYQVLPSDIFISPVSEIKSRHSHYNQLHEF